jgi:hypothetical protein
MFGGSAGAPPAQEPENADAGIGVNLDFIQQ